MALTFILRESKADSQEGTIYLRYSYKDFNDLWLSTGRKISVSQWDKEKRQPKGTSKGIKTLKRYLDTVYREVDVAINQIESEGDDPTPEAVKERYLENTGGKTKASSVVSEWLKFIEREAQSKAPITVKNEKDSLNTFKEFCKAKNKNSLTLRRITKELIAEYGEYLNQFKANTKAKRLKHFKAFLRDVNHQSTELVKFKEVPGDKIFLTEEELTAIECYNKPDLTPVLAKTRDLLVLQCETGLRVSDLMRVGREHIQGGDLLIRAKKTDTMIRMPVSPRVSEILERYDYQLPKMHDQEYNDRIKELAALAIPESIVEVTEHRNNRKIKRKCKKAEVLTSHCSVRTYITLAAGRGMPIPSIAVLTGKSVQTLLRNYLNPNAEQAYKDALTYARPVMKMAV